MVTWVTGQKLENGKLRMIQFEEMETRCSVQSGVRVTLEL